MNHFKAWLFGLCSALAIMAGAAIAQQGAGTLPGGQGQFGPPISTLNGHTSFNQGGAPTLSAACGTGNAVNAGNDTAFAFTTGTGSGACVASPARAYPLRPICNVDTESGTKPSYSVAPNGVITFISVVDSTRYYVICFAQPGGT